MVYKLTFTDARNMPNNAADVLKKLRDIVQNGTLGDYQLDKSADVCLVDISTGQCLPVSSEMMTFATSMSLFTDSQDMITQSPISPNAFESSSNLMMSIFESSVSLQPSDSSQMAHISSLSMIPDVSLSPSSDMSDMIRPSLVSSEDFQSSSTLVTAPLTIQTAMKITSVSFNENMANKTSQEFQDFQTDFCGNVSIALLPKHYIYLIT